VSKTVFNLGNFNQMKTQLAILGMGIMAVQAIFLAPAIAQVEGKFYCGQAYDPIGKMNIPATLMSSPRRSKPIVVILWKSEYFGKEYSPKQRCAKVSPKFQAAYTTGKLEYLKVGTEGKQSIVCAVRTENEPCNKAGMLFTLKSFGNSSNELAALMGNIQGGEAGPDIYQRSSIPSNSNGIVNMQSFLNSAK
jgi:Circadian oscillating protein COP23